jgi:hypothetical protein
MPETRHIEVQDTPAVRIIKRFGGLTKAARAWNKAKSTVQRWKESGYIHPDYVDDILRAAVTEQIELDPRDFNLVDASHRAFNAACTASPDNTAAHTAEPSKRPIVDTDRPHGADPAESDREHGA